MSYFKGFGTGSNSNGQFWYGDYGFIYKKNVGVGGRKNPLYGLICNKPTYIYNKFKPGTGGVGAQSKANRRAQNKRSTVCLDNNCGLFYNYLGQYPRYSYNSINGYFPYPLPLETNFIVNGDYKSLSNSIFNNVIIMYGDTNFVVTGIKTLQVNYIFVGGGGGGGAGGGKGGGGGGGAGGGEISYGICDLYPGRYTIKIGEGGDGGIRQDDSVNDSGTCGSNGGQTIMFENDSGKIKINAFGGEGGQLGFGTGELQNNFGLDGIGGNGGISIQTSGSIGGGHADEVGSNGTNGGGGGASNYSTSSSLSIKKGGNGSKNKIISNNNVLSQIDLSKINLSNINNSDNIITNLTELINSYTSNNIPSLNIFGTGGGAGNAGQKPSIIDFDNLPSGGRGGTAGGIISGIGGIGYVTDSTTPQNGEKGRDALPFLGGGGGGGGGGTESVYVTRTVLNKTETFTQVAGLGGNGGNGGRGLAILYFNNDQLSKGLGTGHVNNIPQGIPTIQQLNSPGLNTSLTSYAVIYNTGTSTGGSVPIDNLSPYISGSTVTVLGDSDLTKSGYTFVGWNTQSNGSGTTYSTGQSFQITSNINFYPVWKLTTYTITYNKNKILASDPPTDPNSPYLENSVVSVLGKGDMTININPLNEVFVNWNTNSDATGTTYVQGNTFTIKSNTTLYAQWGFTITYDANGGSNPPIDTNSPYISGSIANVLGKESMTNGTKTFLYWYSGTTNLDPNNRYGGNIYPDTITINKNITLTAKWSL
jgi:hypothetical protein